MASQIKNINILEVAGGAVAEQIEIEMKKLVENLADPNTDWKAVRTLEIKLAFKNKDERREIINVAGAAKAKLAPNKPVDTMLYSRATTDGVVAIELFKPDPDQITFDEVQGNDTTNVISMRKVGP